MSATPAKGDQYIFIGMAGTQKAIITWGVGKRNAEGTMDFLHDLRSRVIGQPEISADGFHSYRVAMRDAFGPNASHGVIVKTNSVTHLVKEAQGRYSPAAVVAISRISRNVDAARSASEVHGNSGWEAIKQKPRFLSRGF